LCAWGGAPLLLGVVVNFLRAGPCIPPPARLTPALLEAATLVTKPDMLVIPSHGVVGARTRLQTTSGK
jgi:hypothetical protein